MKFAIGKTTDFQEKGYNTEFWRKNHDESLSIVHAEFAEVLTDLDELRLFDVPSKEFNEFMSSEEWTGINPDEVEEYDI